MSSIRWPRHLNPIHVAHLIRLQKNPITALYIFNEAKTRFPTTYHHNGPVYATIISILASSNHLTHMKHVFYQMKSDSCQCKDSTFADAIRAFAKAGRLDDAIELFASIPQFNCVNWTRSFHTLLQIMLSEGDLENAYSLYLENSNRWEVKMGIQSFNLLFAALCRMNRSDLALRVFVEMTEQCCCPDRDTYRILMKGLCDDGRLDDAVHLLYSMFWRISQKGCGADVVVYRILLEALCDRGEFEEAERILGKVLRKGLKAPKRWCRVPDLGADFTSHGSLDAVKGLINDALVTGGVPSLASYSAVIVDLYSEGKIEDADRLFDEMCERGFRPSVLMYEAKIAALCRDGRAGDSAKVVEEEMMEKNCVPTVRTYNAVMGGLCKAGMSMQAVGYLERMGRQVGCVADQTTYEILVDGLCCEGRFIEAGRIMERMVDRRCWPCKATFNRLISGLCMMGRRYEAVLWLEEMVSQGKTPEVFVWNSLVAAFCCDADYVELLPLMMLEED
ncbi:pentatricopeptide repeat-containing protein At1g05600-like [Magnolia sinica]|uniref:pentatricopeptide repeat-containing protein At1g05600-like n=1 Tax=Magnolia sinica TaxID=86752 RepID=UPI00265A6AEF|nr:pentatricopeptide repeat-containing protein At1g05600-like [Magnolia sinica]